MERKFALYHEAGVREYWVVDPENNRLKVSCFKDGTILTSTYGSADIVTVDIFPDMKIALEQVFAG